MTNLKFMIPCYMDEAREQMEYYAGWRYADHVVQYYYSILKQLLEESRS